MIQIAAAIHIYHEISNHPTTMPAASAIDNPINGRFKIYSPVCFDSAAFVSAVSIFIVFALLIGIIAIDFDSAFTVFHHVFFPGKDNWLFDPRYDQILNILPQDFFMNCATLIGSSIILISVGIIVFQLIIRRKTLKKQ